MSINTESNHYKKCERYVKEISKGKYTLSTSWTNPVYGGRGADGNGSSYCIIDNDLYRNGKRNFRVCKSSTLKGIKEWVEKRCV